MVEVDRVEILCFGEFVLINGVIYDENNFFGIELIFGGGGVCDSLIIINFFFFVEVVGNLDFMICLDSEVNVNGIIYDINNLSGVEVLMNVSVNGCDFILNV